MQEHVREGAVVQAKTKNFASDTAEAVAVKLFKRALILKCRG